MNLQVYSSNRRFVVITDPHIKANTVNPVFNLGAGYEQKQVYHKYR